MIDRAFPPQTEWVKAGRKRWEGTSGVGRVLIPPLPLPPSLPPAYPVNGQGRRENQDTALQPSDSCQVLAEFFSLTSILMQILYKACLLPEGTYNL